MALRPKLAELLLFVPVKKEVEMVEDDEEEEDAQSVRRSEF